MKFWSEWYVKNFGYFFATRFHSTLKNVPSDGTNSSMVMTVNFFGNGIFKNVNEFKKIQMYILKKINEFM